MRAARQWIATPDSAAIEGFGYSASRRELEVRFKHGKQYTYLDVPATVFARMKAAESRGQVVAAEVKPHYRFVDR